MEVDKNISAYLDKKQNEFMDRFNFVKTHILDDGFDINPTCGVTCDEYYQIKNIQNECLYKQNKLTELDFDFEEYYQYDYASYFDNTQSLLHKVKPFLFMSNQLTWDIALLLYENLFFHKLGVFDWQKGGYSMVIINYVPEECCDEELLIKFHQMTQVELVDYLKDDLREHAENELEYLTVKMKQAIVEGIVNIDYWYIAKHIRQSINKIYTDTRNTS